MRPPFSNARKEVLASFNRFFFPPRGLESGQGSVGALGLCLLQFPGGTSALSPVLLLLLQEFCVNKLHSLWGTGSSALTVIRTWASLINLFRVESAETWIPASWGFQDSPQGRHKSLLPFPKGSAQNPADLSFFKAFLVKV